MPDVINPWETEPIHIIENTRIAREAFGYGYGAGYCLVGEKELRALHEGKCWAIEINGGEYSLFIIPETENSAD